MRKLKLTLHPNQLKGLSASRHATWFRHIFSAKFTVILLYNYLTSIKRQNLIPYTLKVCSLLTLTSIFSTSYRLQLNGRKAFHRTFQSKCDQSLNDNAIVRNFYPEKFFAFFLSFSKICRQFIRLRALPSKFSIWGISWKVNRRACSQATNLKEICIWSPFTRTALDL